MVETGRDPRARAAEHGFEAMDASVVDDLVDAVIAEHPDEWASFVAGDEKRRGKLTGFFVGKVMQASKGKADGKAVTAALRYCAVSQVVASAYRHLASGTEPPLCDKDPFRSRVGVLPLEDHS